MMMFVNILIFFAFFLVSDALESSQFQNVSALRCFQGISGDVPEDLQKRMNNLGISTDGNMTECASEDKICSFFDCNDQWYFASCSKHYYLCAFEMCNYYCLRCECQSCYTDHCNLPLSMRPNLTTTTMHMDFNRTSNTEEPETTSYQDLSEPPLYENPCIMIGKVSSSAGLAKHVKPLFLLRFMLLLCQVLMMMVSS